MAHLDSLADAWTIAAAAAATAARMKVVRIFIFILLWGVFSLRVIEILNTGKWWPKAPRAKYLKVVLSFCVNGQKEKEAEGVRRVSSPKRILGKRPRSR